MVYYGNCVQEKVLRVANVDNRHGRIFLVTGITSSLWKKKSLLFRVSVHYPFTESLMVNDGNSNKFRKSCNKLKIFIARF